MQIPKAQKRQSSFQSFLQFWDLHVQKLLVECWWNWPLVPICYVCLMVNFTNILRADFSHADPNCVKRHWWLDCLIVLLGFAYIKASRKHVGEIDPGWRWFVNSMKFDSSTKLTNNWQDCSLMTGSQSCQSFSSLLTVVSAYNLNPLPQNHLIFTLIYAWC